jgi:sporulation protein YlmC with PRC-barrel domain
MLLMREVMDKEIVDRHGFKGGKVDDLYLEIRPGELPIVTAVVTGTGSLPPIFGDRLDRLVRWFRRMLLGDLHDPQPQVIPWDRVERIDVVVHIDVDRDDADMMHTEEAVWNRWIRRLPFAQR